jgi:hypothetical protein
MFDFNPIDCSHKDSEVIAQVFSAESGIDILRFLLLKVK